jgi:hypothetical protein
MCLQNCKTALLTARCPFLRLSASRAPCIRRRENGTPCAFRILFWHMPRWYKRWRIRRFLRRCSTDELHSVYMDTHANPSICPPSQCLVTGETTRHPT